MGVKSLSVAIEEPPPQSSDGRNVEKHVFSDYHTFFEPFFNKLVGHYSSRFQWFEDVIPEADKIVNFGFGERGAETFALMWALDAIEVVGFDNKPTRVNQADRKRKKAQDFVEVSVPGVRKFYSPQYAKEFEEWYENKVSVKIRESILPVFKLGDLTTGIEWKSNYFDVGYSRYVLDKIAEKNRLTAVSEMMRLVKSEGHLIIVAPEEAFPDRLKNLNIELIRSVSRDKLGSIEDEKNPPVGRIYLKKSE